jgi:hypothetical protein
MLWALAVDKGTWTAVGFMYGEKLSQLLAESL